METMTLVDWRDIPELVGTKRSYCEQNIVRSRMELLRLLDKQDNLREEIRECSANVVREKRALRKFDESLRRDNDNSEDDRRKTGYNEGLEILSQVPCDDGLPKQI